MKSQFMQLQDTVMALQGLAEMAALIYSPTHDLTVTIAGTGFSDQLKIDSTNAQVLQTRDVRLFVFFFQKIFT